MVIVILDKTLIKIKRLKCDLINYFLFFFKAIYLVKRTMRNQEKHALNEAENVFSLFMLSIIHMFIIFNLISMLWMS
jgi:hypothetical protein